MSPWVQFGPNNPGDSDFVVSTNPSIPTEVVQMTLGGFLIDVGNSIPDRSLMIQGRVSDPDLNQVQLQIELRAVGTNFIGNRTHESAFVSNGQVATIHVPLLADLTGFHWQYRTRDINGATSAWTVFGGNAEADADFSIANAANAAPDTPTGLQQFKSDGGTAIGVGTTTEELRVILSATVTDPDGDMMRLRAEVRPIGTAFTGSATHNGAFFASGSTAILEVASGISTGNSYHWRVWAEDQHGTISPLVSFDPLGGQTDAPPASVDFAVDTSGQTDPAVPTAPGQFTTANVTITLGGVTTESTVRFRATVSDPDSDGVRLQIEVRPAGAAFTGTVTAESALLTSGSTATIDLGNLTEGNYHWQYRTIDGAGRVSAWTPFSAGTDFSVSVATSGGTVGGGGTSGGCGLTGIECLLVLGLLLRRRR